MSLFRPQFWKIPETNDAERRRLPELAAALERRLQDIAVRYPQAVFASSLAVEDMVITDAVCRLKLPIRIITLNTGKLNPETAALIAETNARYQTELEVFYPNQRTADEFEAEFGTTAMYDSVELRRRCCHIRKIEPLNRALHNAPAWLTGQRRSQSETRSELNFEEQDTGRNIAKFNPIFDWEEQDVLGICARAPSSAQCAVSSGLSQYRVRTLHASGQAGRKYPRRTMVVGKQRQ